MLPYLRGRMERIRELKAEIQEIINELEAAGYILQNVFSGAELDAPQAEYRRLLEEHGDEVTTLIDEVQDSGCLVKDLDLGLVDFYSRLDDADVFLCWKLGEMDISYWHRVDEGYGQRQSLMAFDLLSQVSKVH
jgi:hypothetical protein